MKGSLLERLLANQSSEGQVQWVPFVFWSIATIICWGFFGPTIKSATILFDGAYYLTVRCIGIVYLILGVGFCSYKIFLRKTEQGRFSVKGAVFGALSGLCAGSAAPVLTYALKVGPSSAQIMPVVFIGSPLITILVTSVWKKLKPGWKFLAAAVILLMGVWLVLYQEPTEVTKEVVGDNWIFFVATVLTLWGVYGVFAKESTVNMGGSTVRTYFFLAMAYAGAALLASVIIAEPTTVNADGYLAGVLAGCFGCLGSYGAVCALKYGPGPEVVMPICLGSSTVINTVLSLRIEDGGLPPTFYPGLVLLFVGVFLMMRFKP